MYLVRPSKLLLFIALLFFFLAFDDEYSLFASTLQFSFFCRILLRNWKLWIPFGNFLEKVVAISTLFYYNRSQIPCGSGTDIPVYYTLSKLPKGEGRSHPCHDLFGRFGTMYGLGQFDTSTIGCAQHCLYSLYYFEKIDRRVLFNIRRQLGHNCHNKHRPHHLSLWNESPKSQIYFIIHLLNRITILSARQ